MVLVDLKEAGEVCYGGKATGLARLIAAGSRVPPGFAVAATTEPPAAWSDEDRAAFLTRCRAALAEGPVAVRSSALGEDGQEKSYAGLFETALHVTDEAGALAAAARCIASGACARVLAYAGRADAVPVGLVVQKMVAARAAGVCFTRDPSGQTGALVIEAVKGTGDALVSGRAEPERFRAYRSGLGFWERTRESETVERVLDPDEVTRLADEATRLAVAFGEPLDLEWAIDATGSLWLLQARPITTPTVPPGPEVERAFEAVDDGPVSVWSNWNVRETLPEPLTPLAWGFWREEVLVFLSEELGFPDDVEMTPHLYALDLVNGRLYINMNAFLAFPLAGSVLRHLLKIMDARVGGPVDRLIRDGVLRPRRLPGSRVAAALRMAGAGIVSVARLARGLFPVRALRDLEVAAAAISSRPPVTDLSNEALLRELSLWRSPEAGRLRDGLQMEAVAVLVYGVASFAFRRHERASRLLATGISANPTTRIAIAIDDLVEQARPVAAAFGRSLTTPELLAALASEPGGSAWLAALDAFLKTNGHRGPMEFDIGRTRWSEDPTMIVELVRNGLARSPGESLVARMDRLFLERREAIADALADTPLPLRPVLRTLARLVELYMPLREAPKHYGIVIFARIRQATRELGRRLADGGLLSAADEVFLLDWTELAAFSRGGAPPPDLARTLAARREKQERFRRHRAEDFVRSDGIPVVEDEPVTAAVDGVLSGTAVSAGVATGPVKVLLEPDPRLVSDGDVLVMELADPGWTPLFPRAAAVVMEVGGMMCHAAVVAREMGIPAVFAIKGATRLLVDGERVTVDGARGTVTKERTDG